MASPPAGGGGGKIRTRRYHINAKPYRKSQQQQGIIGRVTDSVKSIVPVWLQKYFNKGDDSCTIVTESRSLTERAEDNLANDHHVYGEEQTPRLNDGRGTPEPVIRHVDEPSTSRTTLNFTEVLTRPSLHRSNLNFSMLDSPALHCQPSTSSVYPIGTSGFSLVKEIKDSASQHDDDNISTTSGFSSRASDKDVSVSKNTSVPLLWSPEPDRSHSFTQHNSTSLKKPAFNLSAFGSLSPSLANTSVLKSSQLGDSPFYPGKTTYGGAAATRQSKVRTTPYQAPLRRQMKAKPSNIQTYGVTSSTARRILQSLEKMSSPLADAKRIPSGASPLSLTPDRSVLDVSEFQSRKKIDSHYPPVQKLMTPKSMSVSSNRSMYIKPSLPTTQASKIGRRPDEDRGSRKRNLISESMQEETGQSFSYPNASTPAANGLSSCGAGGKMRRERGAHYTKSVQEKEDVDMPALPNISLPISSAALPTFSFGSLTRTTSPSTSATKPVLNKVQQTTSYNSSPVFTFSSPIVKSRETETPPLGSPIGFTFSIPAVKSADIPPTTTHKPASMIVTSAKDSTSNSTSRKEDQGRFDSPFKPAKTLKEGSVLDILKSPGFASPKTSIASSACPVTNTSYLTRPAIGSFAAREVAFGEISKPDITLWKCDSCHVQNTTTENKCKACSTAKRPFVDIAKQTVISTSSSNTTSTPVITSDFGDKFKPIAGSWDCDTCLVQNKPEATKCVACETPKPGTGVKPALTLPTNTTSTSAVSALPINFPPVTAPLGFGDKFKRPQGSWDCTVCLVQNKAEDIKCISCLSLRPGASVPVTSSSAVSVPFGGSLGFGDKFKKQEGSWDCEICLVQNKPESNKCAACESAKPGTKSELKDFGTSIPSSNTAAPSFKFGIQSSESLETSGSIGGFKFGDQGGFKFGTSSDSGASSTVTVGFSFTKSGENTFGIASTNSKTEGPKKDSTQGNSGFTFGLASGPSNPSLAPLQFGIPSVGTQEKKEIPATGGFMFGTGSAAPATSSESSTGGFNFKKIEEKTESTASPFSFVKPNEKESQPPLGSFAFGKVEQPKDPISIAPFVVGRTDGKSDSLAASGPSLMFGKQTDQEQAKPTFSFGKIDQTKDEPARPSFTFSVGKPAATIEPEPSAKQSLTFGVSTSTPEQGAAKPAFSFLTGASSTTAVSSTLATSSSAFGSTASSASNPPAASFVFGQASSTSGSSAFGSANEPKAPQPFMFPSQDSTPATTSSSTGTTAAGPTFLFGQLASNSSTTTPNFSFGGAANTSSTVAGTTNSPFMFGSGSSAAPAPSFGANKTPAFGQGSTQTNTPAFGTLTPTPMFSAGTQPPIAFGSGASNSQTPVFGPQPSQQPAFGTGTATSNAGPNFQFGGNTSFNFSSSNPSGIFTFGSNPGGPTTQAQPQPPSGGFGFNPPAPSFTLGANGKNTTTRRIKTAIRRRK
ncbi:nuclear pore complex protein Nup153 [Ambystoma mexicanum]|uniref:nuclear pore complex protein Nup153 n=1 Tax=Ambystoma mexicanum TaxID=8296 RepID=UPI0037E88821